MSGRYAKQMQESVHLLWKICATAIFKIAQNWIQVALVIWQGPWCTRMLAISKTADETTKKVLYACVKTTAVWNLTSREKSVLSN